MSSTAPTTGQGLVWNGTAYVPQTPATGTASAAGSSGAVQAAGASGVLADSGCTATAGVMTCSGGFNSSGTTPARSSLTAGTGNIPALAANSAGFAAPASGGTSYLFKLPATVTGGVFFGAAPATGDGVNESALTLVPTGTSGQVLTSTGPTSAPTFQAPATGSSSDALDNNGTILGLPVQEFKNVATPPLANWYAALHVCREQVVRVGIYGDSREIADTTVGAGATPSIAVVFGKKWPDRLATYLQNVCGSHGTGVKPFKFGAGNQLLNANYYTSSGTFTPDGALGPYQGGNVADSIALRATTNGATISFTPGQKIDHLNAYCESGSGINPWTLQIDGNAVGTCGTASGSVTATLATSSAVTLAISHRGARLRNPALRGLCDGRRGRNRPASASTTSPSDPARRSASALHPPRSSPSRTSRRRTSPSFNSLRMSQAWATRSSNDQTSLKPALLGTFAPRQTTTAVTHFAPLHDGIERATLPITRWSRQSATPNHDGLLRYA